MIRDVFETQITHVICAKYFVNSFKFLKRFCFFFSLILSIFTLTQISEISKFSFTRVKWKILFTNCFFNDQIPKYWFKETDRFDQFPWLLCSLGLLLLQCVMSFYNVYDHSSPQLPAFVVLSKIFWLSILIPFLPTIAQTYWVGYSLLSSLFCLQYVLWGTKSPSPFYSLCALEMSSLFLILSINFLSNSIDYSNNRLRYTLDKWLDLNHIQYISLQDVFLNNVHAVQSLKATWDRMLLHTKAESETITIVLKWLRHLFYHY